MKYIGVIAGKSGDNITYELHKYGFKVALVMGKKYESGFDLADKVLVSDLRNHAEIENFFRKANIDKIIVGTGHRYALELLKYLDDKGFTLSIDLDATIFCKNKYIFKKFLVKNKFCTPNFVLKNIDEDNEDFVQRVCKCLGFPCVLKSIDDIFPPEKIFNRETLLDRIIGMNNRGFFVEEFIKGADFTVPIFSTSKVNCLSIMSYSKAIDDKLLGFNDSYTRELHDEEKTIVKDICIRLIEKIGVKGLVRIDLMVKDQKIYILEINSIIVSGNVNDDYDLIFKRSGINRALLIVMYALNKFFSKQYKRKLKKIRIRKNDILKNKFDIERFKDSILNEDYDIVIVDKRISVDIISQVKNICCLYKIKCKWRK